MPRLMLTTTTLVAASLFAGCQSQNTDATAQKPSTVSPSKTEVTANQTSTDARIVELQRAADAARSGVPSSPHDKPGFVTKVDDGRLWVFKKDAKELAEFVKHGELVKSVTRVAAGPNRMTVRAADEETIDAYLAAEPKTVNAAADPYARPGFVTRLKDGRLWVFQEGAKELAEFEKHGELVKSVTRVAAGPNRVTVRSGDAATIDAYLAAAN